MCYLQARARVVHASGFMHCSDRLCMPVRACPVTSAATVVLMHVAGGPRWVRTQAHTLVLHLRRRHARARSRLTITRAARSGVWHAVSMRKHDEDACITETPLTCHTYTRVAAAAVAAAVVAAAARRAAARSARGQAGHEAVANRRVHEQRPQHYGRRRGADADFQERAVVGLHAVGQVHAWTRTAHGTCGRHATHAQPQQALGQVAAGAASCMLTRRHRLAGTGWRGGMCRGWAKERDETDGKQNYTLWLSKHHRGA